MSPKITTTAFAALFALMAYTHHAGASDLHIKQITENIFAIVGDLVYLERLLGISSSSNFKNWIPAFETMAALKPKHIIPGHGRPSTLEHARADTYDYLINLKTCFKYSGERRCDQNCNCRRPEIL